MDNYILDEIQSSDIREPILVTNARLFQLQAGLMGNYRIMIQGALHSCR